MTNIIENENTVSTVKLEGILSQGYGIAPKMIMKDKNLSVEAKAIYAYLASYAGGGETAFPSISLMCEDLKISDKRLRKHRQDLVDQGYIQIKREQKENGWSNNIYTLVHFVPVQNVSIRDVPGQNVPLQNVPVQKVPVQNVSTNNNSLNNNSLNNNSSNNNNYNQGKKEPVVVDEPKNKKTENPKSKPEESKLNPDSELREISNFYQNNFGVISPHIIDDIKHWTSDIGFELVLEAMKRAVENQRNYSYAKGIMRNWLKNNIKTLEDVEAADVAFNNRRNNNFNNTAPTKKESLPDWAKENGSSAETVEKRTTSDSGEAQGEFADRLAKLRALRDD